MTGKNRTEQEMDFHRMTGQGSEDAGEQSGQQELPEMTLEESFEQLEQIIEKLEDRGTSLEESFCIYQTGMELLKKCSEKIDRVEKKVLVMDEEGGLDEF